MANFHLLNFIYLTLKDEYICFLYLLDMNPAKEVYSFAGFFYVHFSGQIISLHS